MSIAIQYSLLISTCQLHYVVQSRPLNQNVTPGIHMRIHPVITQEAVQSGKFISLIKQLVTAAIQPHGGEYLREISHGDEG